MRMSFTLPSEVTNQRGQRRHKNAAKCQQKADKEEEGGRIGGRRRYSLSSAESYLQFLQFDMLPNGLYSSIFVILKEITARAFSRGIVLTSSTAAVNGTRAVGTVG